METQMKSPAYFQFKYLRKRISENGPSPNVNVSRHSSLVSSSAVQQVCRAPKGHTRTYMYVCHEAGDSRARSTQASTAHKVRTQGEGSLLPSRRTGPSGNSCRCSRRIWRLVWRSPPRSTSLLRAAVTAVADGSPLVGRVTLADVTASLSRVLSHAGRRWPPLWSPDVYRRRSPNPPAITGRRRFARKCSATDARPSASRPAGRKGIPRREREMEKQERERPWPRRATVPAGHSRQLRCSPYLRSNRLSTHQSRGKRATACRFKWRTAGQSPRRRDGHVTRAREPGARSAAPRAPPRGRRPPLRPRFPRRDLTNPAAFELG